MCAVLRRDRGGLALLEIFEFAFMRRAFAVGIVVGLITPLIGVVVVLRRLSMIGDALSHSSLAGVAAGLIMNVNPIAGAVAASLVSAFAIEGVRKAFPRYSEMAIAVIMSAGVGLAGVLSGYVKSAANFNSFLFGSIVAITDFEWLLVMGIGLLVLLASFFFFRELFAITFDEESARVVGMPVGRVNFIFTLLTAVTVSVAARAVGALVVSSLMVLPVAVALQVARSYRQTVGYSMFFGVLFTVAGLLISYYCETKPGGTIALVGVLALLACLLVRVMAGRGQKTAVSKGGRA